MIMQMILTEKQQKISFIIFKYEYLTGEEIQPFWSKKSENTSSQAKFTYSPLGSAFGK